MFQIKKGFMRYLLHTIWIAKSLRAKFQSNLLSVKMYSQFRTILSYSITIQTRRYTPSTMKTIVDACQEKAVKLSVIIRLINLIQVNASSICRFFRRLRVMNGHYVIYQKRSREFLFLKQSLTLSNQRQVSPMLYV